MADAPIDTIEIAHGGMRAELLTLGATLRRLDVPGRDGTPANVVLGYRDLAEYRAHPRFYGVVAGRFANRIGGARFSLDGTEYRLPANNGANSLHSGPKGFDLQDWTIEARDAHSVTFGLTSPHLDHGFPGKLDVRVRYALRDGGLAIGFRATTDRATVINLTHHAYFNLAGEGSGTAILDHLLQIPASQITPTDAALIPTGAFADVAGGPFDFRSPKPIGRDIAADDPQLRQGGGYDHNFVLVGAAGTIRRVATLFDPKSGRVLDLHSTEPGLQFYTGNHLANGAPGTSGGSYPARGGLCLEPQKFPDSPNKPNFPSARLDPGKEYRHDMAFRFRTAKDSREAFG
ncbi:aldose 1-epimerase [Sphingomonas naasensis]|uniref:Aldose 1-epimerase n=1 Tax=Sphingomonas naasensis TaxID=1344951 RepID=A0A4S1WGU3_9SPHN|nr:aldose epimerase family protein [Sphingomonas naasensis]NIJ22088.1 aldose 1-epimerase [Sphingomonas naasensis]TGX42239.1 galactose mutarotase [Sphingomonas naasensis]